MTREEAIANLNMISVAFVDPVTGEQRKLIDDTFEMAIKALEQEPCEDEYIKVPKKALKYRTAGMVAYNAEWLKKHFDIERAVICGAQEPCEDTISRQAALRQAINAHKMAQENGFDFKDICEEYLNVLPPVNPQQKHEDVAKAFQLGVAFGFGEKHDEMDKVIEEVKKAIEPKPKTGHWILIDKKLLRYKCSECGEVIKLCKKSEISSLAKDKTLSDYPFSHCGARMLDSQERSGEE